ncbi:MAG: vitamin B12 dependent-methionine synthase activation domain-containing protein, partial [Bacteroidota bacterium]
KKGVQSMYGLISSNGKYPAIFENQTIGEEARRLYDDANDMLDMVVDQKLLTAKAVTGLFEANSVNDDDVQVFEGDQTAHFHFLRQQGKKGKGLPNFSLADFVAPDAAGYKDYFGGFAVTAGIGIEALIDQYEAEKDDYKSIMIKALADRLAEAFAELMHEKVRKESWGYAKYEELDNEDLIKEKYQGIRPAPGYPACPDHTEKKLLFDLLNVEENTGITLTESFAMYPAASVSGFYFSHPESTYFGLGNISKDQVEQYAKRKGIDIEVMEKWLAPNLNYEGS